jgi:hypothetical protein
MNVTIEQIEAEHRRLAELIANLKANTPKLLTIPLTHIELQPGEHYAGLLLDDQGAPLHHVVLVPGEAEDVSWDDAMSWARTTGGELPTRREQSLLFANLKSHFREAWYWSGEQHAESASRAWFQGFNDGTQLIDDKSYEARARAVRRLPL